LPSFTRGVLRKYMRGQNRRISRPRKEGRSSLQAQLQQHGLIEKQLRRDQPRILLEIDPNCESWANPPPGALVVPLAHGRVTISVVVVPAEEPRRIRTVPCCRHPFQVRGGGNGEAFKR
jgi:hypothetical protein